jgi:hypothetical protein
MPLCVRWYLRYALSYRAVEEFAWERGLSVDHTTVFRSVQRYALELDKWCPAPSVRPKKPSSPTRKMFLSSPVKELVALDFFVVPTVTYKVLFVLLMLSHHRRRVAHVKVTAHPTAEWTAQPLVEAFPWDAAP